MMCSSLKWLKMETNVLMSEDIELISWKEYFEDLMNVENKKERKMDGGQWLRKSRELERRTRPLLWMDEEWEGSSSIPVEMYRWLGERAVAFVNKLFNTLLEAERSCSNYIWIKLMTKTMHLWERVEATLRRDQNTSKHQKEHYRCDVHQSSLKT